MPMIMSVEWTQLDYALGKMGTSAAKIEGCSKASGLFNLCWHNGKWSKEKSIRGGRRSAESAPAPSPDSVRLVCLKDGLADDEPQSHNVGYIE